MLKNKKAVSVVVGYVLLIATMIAISGIVYLWMKSYIPTEIPSCPDETSIFVQDVFCDSGVLNLRLKNSGRFQINGVYLKATTSTEQEIATLDLVGNLGAGFFKLDPPLNPGEETLTYLFEYSQPIFKLEVTPVRFQEVNSKQQVLSCSNAKIIETLPKSC